MHCQSERVRVCVCAREHATSNSAMLLMSGVHGSGHVGDDGDSELHSKVDLRVTTGVPLRQTK